jgi:hypothetical protein
VSRHSGSAPDGSVRAAAIQNALAQWNRIIPIDRWITEGAPFSGTHDLSTAPSQISFAHPLSPHLGGALGRAFMRTGLFCTILGFDIVMSTAASYAPPPDSLPAGGPSGADPGWSAVLHEFGHAFGQGLSMNGGHPTTFAVMRASTPLPTFGAFPFFASAASPAPDDAAGMRALYGAPVTANTNVASTQTVLDPNAGIVTNVAPSTLNVCRGQQFFLNSNTANTGMTQVTINHRIYMQPFLPSGVGNPWDANHWANVTVSQQFGAVHAQNNTNRITHVVRVPCNTPVGSYNIMHFADSTNAVPNEYNEFDNTSQYPLTIAVQNCTSGC